MAKGQGRSSGQGVKLLYIRDYLYTHATKEHPKNAKDISKYLASMGVSASVKTIYNDILRLQIDFGVPIEYNPSKWGYYITQPQFEPYELRLLVDSVQSAKFLTENMAAQLTQKIKQLADIYTKDSLNRQAYVSNRVRNMNEEAMRGLDCIYEAISKDRKISFRYFKYTSNRDKPKQYTKHNGSAVITVSPYLVVWDGERHVLVAHTEQEGMPAIASICADRVERVRVLDEPREGKDTIRESGLLEFKFRPFGIGMFSEGITTVQLLAHNDCATHIVEKFGTDLPMIPYDASHFTVSLQVELTPLFYDWLALYPGRIKVLSPPQAIEAMQALAITLADSYNVLSNERLLSFLLAGMVEGEKEMLDNQNSPL